MEAAEQAELCIHAIGHTVKDYCGRETCHTYRIFLDGDALAAESFKEREFT